MPNPGPRCSPGARPRRRSRSSGRARTWRCRSSAHCAAALSSALRMSGRRRKSSAGTEITALVGGAFGIVLRSREQGIRTCAMGWPSSVAEGVLCLFEDHLRSSGIEARVRLEQRGRLRHIELGGRAVAEVGLRDAVAPPLEAPRSAALARRAPRKVRMSAVGARHLGGEGHQSIPIVGHGGEAGPRLHGPRRRAGTCPRRSSSQSASNPSS